MSGFRGKHTFCMSDLVMKPVSHDSHVLGGPPQCFDDRGVADDHDEAGDQEGDDQLVDSEVDTENDDDRIDIAIMISTLYYHLYHCSR